MVFHQIVSLSSLLSGCGRNNRDQKYFHKINFPMNFSVLVISCSLEIILWHYYSTDCNNFGTGRKLHELWNQYTCFISVVNLIPEEHAFKLYVRFLSLFSRRRH